MIAQQSQGALQRHHSNNHIEWRNPQTKTPRKKIMKTTTMR